MSAARLGVTYRALLTVPGISQISAALLLSRLGDSMWQLVVVLFVLERFRSPALAGFCILAGQVPGKVVSPIAGALLDRYGRRYLVLVDYVVAALITALIALLNSLAVLTPILLVGLLFAASLTQPLSMTGLRSLFPLLLHARLWDRANAIDSGTYLVASLAGPSLGGLTVGFGGGEAGIIVVAVLFVAAAGVTYTLDQPTGLTSREHGVLRSAWVGLRYFCANRTLRALAISMSIVSVGSGILLIAVPVLVIRGLGGNSILTGFLFACYGFSGLVSGVLFSRLNSEGHEVAVLAIGNGLIGLGMLILAIGRPLGLVVFALLLAGIGLGPADIAMFGLRQRKTDPRLFGRALALSMAFNGIGSPVGAAIAGILVAGDRVAAAFVLGGVLTILAVLLAIILIPLTE